MKTLLDKKDQKILYYLSQNARHSNTKLAKKIHLSKNAVAYRIDRLQHEQIITQFSTVISLGSFGYTTVALLIRFNEDIYEKKEIIAYFKHHPRANWVASLTGHWDLFCEFIIEDLDKLYQLTDELIVGNHAINTYQFFISKQTLRVEHLIEDFAQHLHLEKTLPKKRTTTTHTLDTTDKKILYHLNQNAVQSYRELAQKTNTTMDIIRYHIKNLERKNIILKYFAEISLPKLNYTEYIYHLQLKNPTPSTLERLKHQLQHHPAITYAFLDASNLHILFVCAYQHPEGIDTLSRTLRKNFPNIIDNQYYCFIKEQLLFTQFPRALL